ncbi:hypothetical protein N9Y17_04055, partial [Gammaproteobacteria bacterium]|nr:hypothetical protein [Gammaproteobacteria bacterium]
MFYFQQIEIYYNSQTNKIKFPKYEIKNIDPLHVICLQAIGKYELNEIIHLTIIKPQNSLVLNNTLAEKFKQQLPKNNTITEKPIYEDISSLINVYEKYKNSAVYLRIIVHCIQQHSQDNYQFKCKIQILPKTEVDKYFHVFIPKMFYVLSTILEKKFSRDVMDEIHQSNNVDDQIFSFTLSSPTIIDHLRKYNAHMLSYFCKMVSGLFNGEESEDQYSLTLSFALQNILKLHKLKGPPIKISIDFTKTPDLNICPSRKSINCFLVVISDLLKKICNNNTVYFAKIVSKKTDYHLINISISHKPIKITKENHESDISHKNSMGNAFSWSGMDQVPENIFRHQHHGTIEKHPTGFTIT